MITRRNLLMGAAAGAAAFTLPRSAWADDPPAPDFGIATLVGDGLELMGRATGPAEMRFRIWPTGHPEMQDVSPWLPTNGSNAAKWYVPSLGGCRWSWKFNVRDPNTGLISPGRTQQVRSRPAAGDDSEFSFVFASCTGPTDPKAARWIHGLKPAFVAWLGDFGYPDDDPNVEHTKAGIVANLRRFITSDSFSPVFRSTAWVGQMDDHDLDQDEAWRDTAPAYPMEAWANVMPGYAYPGPTYRSFRVGQAEFWLLDCRRYSDDPTSRNKREWESPDGRSILGRDQKAWLKAGLEESRARVKFVLSPMSTMYGRWTRDEVEELGAVCAASSSPVMWLTGDRHAAAHVEYDGLVELLASPVRNQRTMVPSRPGVVWTNDLDGDGVADFNCFGHVTVTPAGVTGRVVDENGVVRYEAVLA